MSFFSFFAKSITRGQRHQAAGRWRQDVTLNLEALEKRCVPTSSSNVISGYVYYDANANGLYNPGETPIANTRIYLYNSSNQIINSDRHQRQRLLRLQQR